MQNTISVLRFTMPLTRVLMIFGLFSLLACQPDEPFDMTDTDIPDINDDDPGDNDPTVNMENLRQLGRLLFWDPILSGEFDVSCATCHHPDFGYADGRALPIGIEGRGLGPNRLDVGGNGVGLVKRNSPTILNTVFNGMDEDGNYDITMAPMFWDNRAQSLEEQALLPLHSFEEMRGHAFDESVTIDSLLRRLRANNQYQTLFSQAFGQDNSITEANLANAIAAFERTITATDSPFDRFQAGDQNAMTQQQIQGMDRFGQLGCVDCHSGPMFSDFELHVVGVPDHPMLDETDTGANGTYAFRTPSLRNLDETGPYFHNGVAGNLQTVIQFYRTVRAPNGGPAGGGLRINQNLNQNDLDPEIRNLGNPNNNDIQLIISFIGALNDPNFDRSIPTSVPSGLNPGGNLD